MAQEIATGQEKAEVRKEIAKMIASGYPDKCVDRAFSTMRLALGYETGLPECWPEDGASEVPNIISVIGDTFHQHKVQVWCLEDKYSATTSNVVYAGPTFTNSNGEADQYLMAFAYHPDNDNVATEGHMVVGAPTCYEGMAVSLIIGVELARRKNR